MVAKLTSFAFHAHLISGREWDDNKEDGKAEGRDDQQHHGGDTKPCVKGQEITNASLFRYGWHIQLTLLKRERKRGHL